MYVVSRSKKIRVDLSVMPIIENLYRPQTVSWEATIPLHLLGMKGIGHERERNVYLSVYIKNICITYQTSMITYTKTEKTYSELLKFSLVNSDSSYEITKNTFSMYV